VLKKLINFWSVVCNRNLSFPLTRALLVIVYISGVYYCCIERAANCHWSCRMCCSCQVWSLCWAECLMRNANSRMFGWRLVTESVERCYSFAVLSSCFHLLTFCVLIWS